VRRPYSGNPGIIQELSCKKERKENNEVKVMENKLILAILFCNKTCSAHFQN